MTDSSHQIRDLSPPGEILGEVMEERGVTGAELARRLGCTEKHVSQLVNGRVPLTTDMALQLEQVLGIPAQFWNSLEFNYRSEQKRACKLGPWSRTYAGYCKLCFNEWCEEMKEPTCKVK